MPSNLTREEAYIRPLTPGTLHCSDMLTLSITALNLPYHEWDWNTCRCVGESNVNSLLPEPGWSHTDNKQPRFVKGEWPCLPVAAVAHTASLWYGCPPLCVLPPPGGSESPVTHWNNVWFSLSPYLQYRGSKNNIKAKEMTTNNIKLLILGEWRKKA